MSRFEQRMIEGGALSVPERPSLKRLAELNGEPPWQLDVPYPDILPDEAMDLIGSVRMNGVVFRRERPFHEQVRELRAQGMSAQEALREMGIDEDG